MSLTGKKTYIVGGLIVVFAALLSFGKITPELFEKVLGILLGTGLITLRMGVNNA